MEFYGPLTFLGRFSLTTKFGKSANIKKNLAFKMDAKRTELDADFESIENEKKDHPKNEKQKTFANRNNGKLLCNFFITFSA